MKSAIVTGAGGFIGGRLANRLTERGVHVTAIDILDALPEGTAAEYHRADFADKESLRGLNIKTPDVFYHLAWRGIDADSRNDFPFQLENVRYTLNALELAKRINAGKVILPGSASEFALSGKIVTGYDAPAPSDAYGAAKAACRVMGSTYAARHGLPFICTVISSVYGPGRDDGNILSYAIKKLLKGEKPSFTKLEQLWDFLYIDDLLDALYAVGEKGIPGTPYVIGNGVSRPMSEYIYILRDVIDPSLPLGIGDLPYKMGIPDNAAFDITRLREDTGFAPAVGFEDGIRGTVEFFALQNYEEG